MLHSAANLLARSPPEKVNRRGKERGREEKKKGRRGTKDMDETGPEREDGEAASSTDMTTL